eukprot:g1149.t1
MISVTGITTSNTSSYEEFLDETEVELHINEELVFGNSHLLEESLLGAVDINFRSNAFPVTEGEGKVFELLLDNFASQVNSKKNFEVSYGSNGKHEYPELRKHGSIIIRTIAGLAPDFDVVDFADEIVEERIEYGTSDMYDTTARIIAGLTPEHDIVDAISRFTKGNGTVHKETAMLKYL